MKGRTGRLIISAALSCALVLALASPALAVGDVNAYKVESGDSVIKFCQQVGVDYYKYKGLIMTLNGWTSEAQANSIAVGSEVIIPSSASSADYLVTAFAATGTGSAGQASGVVSSGTISTGAGSVGSSWRDQVYPSYWSTVASNTGTTGTTGAAATLPTLATGDSVKYYIVRHTIQRGETLTGIYSAWGLSYKTFAAQIQKLNKLKSLDKINAGQTLMLPTTSTAAQASYAVIAHKIQSGETVTGICSAYGLSYSSSKTMLETFNPDMNFNRIRAGAYIYLMLSCN